MLAKAFGPFGPVLGIASVGGPVLAGFVISADLFGLSWRPIFLINVVLGGIGLVVAARILPRDDGDRSAVVDSRGSGLLAVTMFGLLYRLVGGSTDGWGAVPVASVVIGASFFVASGWSASPPPPACSTCRHCPQRLPFVALMPRTAPAGPGE